MFIEATLLKRGRYTHMIMINTDQIVSVDSLLRRMDDDYKVTMSNGQQFIVEDEAKEQLSKLIHGKEGHTYRSTHEKTDPRVGAPEPFKSPGG